MGRTHIGLSWTPAFILQHEQQAPVIFLGWHREYRTFNINKWSSSQEIDDFQKRTRGFADVYQMEVFSIEYCYSFYSSVSISNSAFSKKDINAIGHSYTIVIDMQCASSVFYMY